MASTRITQIRMWQRALVCCIICGTPMSLPGRVQDQARSKSRDIDAPIVQEEDKEEIEESTVRVCMFRFGLLKYMELCHVIDEYAHLKNLHEFQKAQNKFYKAITNKQLLAKHRANIGDITDDLYNRGRDICLRTGAKWVVAGCKDCNMAMNYSVENSLSVVQTTWNGDDTLVLDTDDQKTKNEIYKLLHQIVLFFKHAPDTDAWQIRTREDIVKTTCLQRIVANLGLWGKTGNFRFRCIAIFYASLYIREAREEVDAMTAEDWHLHCFRRFYTDEYKENNQTFFGMQLSEATALYSTSELKFASRRTVNIEVRLKMFMERMDADKSMTTVDYMTVTSLHNELAATAVDEESLYTWALKRWCKPLQAVRGLLWFLLYNIKGDPSARLLYLRTQSFAKAILPIIKRNHHHHGSTSVEGAIHTRTRSKTFKQDAP